MWIILPKKKNKQNISNTIFKKTKTKYKKIIENPQDYTLAIRKIKHYNLCVKSVEHISVHQ